MTSMYQRFQHLFLALKVGAVTYLVLVFAAGELGLLTFEQTVLNMLIVIGAFAIAGAGE